MKCPHFERVNFEPITQIKNDQQLQHTHQNSSPFILPLQTIIDEVYNIPQQEIHLLNRFKTKMSNYKQSFATLTIKESSNTSWSFNNLNQTIKEASTIKLPQQMNIKKMITPFQSCVFQPQIDQPIIEQFDENERKIFPLNDSISQDYEIPSENEVQSISKKPQALVSKSSQMVKDNPEIFNGLVFLKENKKNAFQCQLKDNIIRILKQAKIKYFIELEKVAVSIKDAKQTDRTIKMSLRCQRKNQTIDLTFMNPFQKEIFLQVFYNSIKKIKQTRNLKRFYQQQKENLSHKTNSIYSQIDSNINPSTQATFIPLLGDNESEILDQKMSISDSQQAQSISSMSTNSYEGDSMVFETQRMLFQQVKTVGNTFDILLFKNKGLMSKVQRIFTNSDYDHTALLLKTASNDLLMLEATSNFGVAIYTFNSLMNIDKSKYFSRIAIRRYNGDKNFIKVSRLQNFIRKTVGKKYKFDPMYLVKSQANQDKETFFCSELVAEALQDAGILSNQSPSFKYLPKHFASENLNNQIINGRYSDIIILQ